MVSRNGECTRWAMSEVYYWNVFKHGDNVLASAETLLRLVVCNSGASFDGCEWIEIKGL